MRHPSYFVQDLERAETTIFQKLLNNWRYITIYRFLRADKRWCFIGDWPLISFIFDTARDCGKKFDNSDIFRVMRIAQDKEFTKIGLTSELIAQLCG